MCPIFCWYWSKTITIQLHKYGIPWTWTCTGKNSKHNFSLLRWQILSSKKITHTTIAKHWRRVLWKTQIWCQSKIASNVTRFHTHSVYKSHTSNINYLFDSRYSTFGPTYIEWFLCRQYCDSKIHFLVVVRKYEVKSMKFSLVNLLVFYDPSLNKCI